jgi:ribosomal protein L24
VAKKDIHVGVSLHKLALITDEKSGKTSRVGYKVTDGAKTRVARQQKNKEIK